MKTPKHYRCPLRKREDIVDYIFSVTSQRTYHGYVYPFCFNVKVPSLDASFDNLLKLYREVNDASFIDKSIAAARKVYKAIDISALCDVATTTLRNMIHDDKSAYHILYNGTQVNVTYSFEGRSDGWLSIDEFEGLNFITWDFSKSVLLDSKEVGYKKLRKLYSLVVMLEHDLSKESIKIAIEREMAWLFFDLQCDW